MFGYLLTSLLGLCLLLISLSVILLLKMIWRLARHRQHATRKHILWVLLGIPALAVLLGLLPGVNWLMDLDLTDKLFGQAMILPSPEQESRESFADLNGNFSLFRIYHLTSPQIKQIENAIASHPDFPKAEKTNWTRHTWVKLSVSNDARQVQPLIDMAQSRLGARLSLHTKILTSFKTKQGVYFAGYSKGWGDLELYLVFPKNAELIQIAIDT